MTVREAINSKEFNQYSNTLVFIDGDNTERTLSFDGDYGCIHYEGSITPGVYKTEYLIDLFGDIECKIERYKN